VKPGNYGKFPVGRGCKLRERGSERRKKKGGRCKTPDVVGTDLEKKKGSAAHCHRLAVEESSGGRQKCPEEQAPGNKP